MSEYLKVKICVAKRGNNKPRAYESIESLEENADVRSHNAIVKVNAFGRIREIYSKKPINIFYKGNDYYSESSLIAINEDLIYNDKSFYVYASYLDDKKCYPSVEEVESYLKDFKHTRLYEELVDEKSIKSKNKMNSKDKRKIKKLIREYRNK